MAGYACVDGNAGEDCKLKEASNFRRIPKLTLKVLHTLPLYCMTTGGLVYGSALPIDGHSSEWLVLVGS